MNIWRKLVIASAILFFAGGLWILGYDSWFIGHFGFDYNDVVYIGGEDFSDWPTGERPSWTIIPLYVYSIPFFLIGFFILIFRPKSNYHGRIRFGTE